jgi:tyrosinase
MAENIVPDQIVASPTYMADIRFYFRPEDVDHMGLKGRDLGTYDGVMRNAHVVLTHTAPPNADMPPDPAGKWSAERWQTFRNWIVNGYPVGTATPPDSGSSSTPRDRLRKNVASLSAQEIETLRTSFTGLMERPPGNDDSYFALAGIHGLPQASCLHHEDLFNPWHRVYLKLFEDALRSVPGCQDVTLPYWDVTTPLPDLLQQPPFASYTLPQDPGATANPPDPGTYFPYTTIRNPSATIIQNLQDLGVFDEIATSLSQSRWGAYNINGYQDFSIQAHDGGHIGTGPTMMDQNVASYDPVFWFYHANIDRLWLKWQRNVQGTTLTGFKSTIDGDASWLSDPLFNALPPFTKSLGTTADETISYGISYDDEGLAIALENKVGSVEAARKFSIKRSAPVSVRVKDIDRLNIPGSFVVKLLANGEPIAKRAFFQPKSPRNCDNCRKQALINIDFRIEQEKLLDRKLSVEIEVPGHEEIGARFPMSQAGNPTINARLLLEDE